MIADETLDDLPGLALEWIATIAGCIVGVKWWILHCTYLVEIYWRLVPGFKGFDVHLQPLKMPDCFSQISIFSSHF